jgi:uncharacterized protein YydD (DUF2326 family)
MRLYKHNNSGIEITDAIRDKESVGIVMPNKQIFTPDLSYISYGSIRKAILFVPSNTNNIRLEIY